MEVSKVLAASVGSDTIIKESCDQELAEALGIPSGTSLELYGTEILQHHAGSSEPEESSTERTRVYHIEFIGNSTSSMDDFAWLEQWLSLFCVHRATHPPFVKEEEFYPLDGGWVRVTKGVRPDSTIGIRILYDSELYFFRGTR